MNHQPLLFASISLMLLVSCVMPGVDNSRKNQIEKQDYTALKQHIIAKKDSMQVLFKNVDAANASNVLDETKSYIFKTITDDLFDAWYGTPWDFNGQTRMPGTGKIACGYFVTAILSDAGFKIPATTWAQLASESMILKLTKEVKRFSNAPIEEVMSYLQKNGNALYIVGMDTHVGFIYVEGKEMVFVHSSYYHPETGVMAEALDTNNPLKNSKYRVLGKLLEKDMLLQWLHGQAYE